MKNAAVCFVLFSISLTLHVQHLLIYTIPVCLCQSKAQEVI